MQYEWLPPCKIKTSEDMGWGEHFIPLKRRASNGESQALRVLVMGCGHPDIDTLGSILGDIDERGANIEIVGLVTDNPNDPEAKISAGKRLWRLYSEEERELILSDTLQRAMYRGIEVYTGAIKAPYFRDLIKKWDPEIIVVNGLGQRIDRYILDVPSYGTYNFHPSDLTIGVGRGVDPYTGAIQQGQQTTRVTAHHVDERIDSGAVVGLSPPIRITRRDGTYSDDLLAYHLRIIPVSFRMVVYLLRLAEQKKHQEDNSTIGTLDFGAAFTQPEKEKLLAPMW